MKNKIIIVISIIVLGVICIGTFLSVTNANEKYSGTKTVKSGIKSAIPKNTPKVTINPTKIIAPKSTATPKPTSEVKKATIVPNKSTARPDRTPTPTERNHTYYISPSTIVGKVGDSVELRLYDGNENITGNLKSSNIKNVSSSYLSVDLDNENSVIYIRISSRPRTGQTSFTIEYKDWKNQTRSQTVVVTINEASTPAPTPTPQTQVNHEYVPAQEWTITDNYHYKACNYPNCMVVAHKTPLTFDSKTKSISKYGTHTWTQNTYGSYTMICSACGATQKEHEYMPAEEWSYDSEAHWKKCRFENCNVASHKVPSSLSTYGSHAYENGVCICGKKCEHPEDKRVKTNYVSRSYTKHTYNEICSICNKIIKGYTEDHSFDEKTYECICGQVCKHEHATKEIINPKDGNISVPKMEAIANILAMSDDDKNNNHIIVSTCIYCKNISAASLEKHDFKANEKDSYLHKCTKCNASHNVKNSINYEEPEEPKPANCVHGNITYKKCNVCGIDFDEKDDGKIDLTKHVIQDKDIKKKEHSGSEVGESDGNTFRFGKHKITGKCSVCSTKNVTIEESCKDFISADSYYNDNDLSKYGYRAVKGEENYYYYSTNDLKSDNFGHFTVLKCSRCFGPGRINKPVRHDSDKNKNETFLSGSYKYVDDDWHSAKCSACGWSGYLHHDENSRKQAVIKLNSKALNMNAPEKYNDDIIKHRPNITDPIFRTDHYTFAYCAQCDHEFFDTAPHNNMELVWKRSEVEQKSSTSPIDKITYKHTTIDMCRDCEINIQSSGKCEGGMNFEIIDFGWLYVTNPFHAGSDRLWKITYKCNRCGYGYYRFRRWFFIPVFEFAYIRL